MSNLRPKKILLLSGYWQASLACLQSLGRKGFDVFIVDGEHHLALAHSRYCRSQIFSPSARDEDLYCEFLRGLVSSRGYDVLIPVSETTTRYCVKHQQEFAGNIRFIVPSYEIWSIAADKSKLNQFALSKSIPAPRTFFPENNAEVMALLKEIVFPCVLKLPLGAATQGVFFTDKEKDFLAAYDKKDFGGQWPIIQEFVKGDFYSFTAIAWEGKVLMYFMHKTDQRFSVFGTPPFSYSTNDPELYERASALISALKWSGPINMDYIKDAQRGHLLLEVNPRFPGSLNFSYRMGIDMPWAYYHLAAGGDPSEIRMPKYKTGIMFRSMFPTEILWCYKESFYRPILKNSS